MCFPGIGVERTTLDVDFCVSSDTGSNCQFFRRSIFLRKNDSKVDEVVKTEDCHKMHKKLKSEALTTEDFI
jgi:hypothetical protein